MQDTIIKGTGNSHTLKSVANFMSLYPTYDAFAAALVAGTLPVDIGALVAAGVQQQGMSLTKANLLADATGTKLGLATTATPNDALSALASRYGTCSTAAATKAKVVTLAGFTLATGAVVAVKFTYGNTAASPTLNVNGTGAKSIAVYGTTAAGSGAWSAGEVVLFVYDGTRWVMNSGAILGTGSNCEIYTGSYVGNGQKTFSLTFPKLPVFLVIGRKIGANAPLNTPFFGSVILDGINLLGIDSSSAQHYDTLSINGTTITLTNSNTFSTTLNQGNTNYYYVAFAAANGTNFA